MVSASEQLTNSHPNSSKCGGGFEGGDILLSLLLEVQKGFLEDTELQLLSEGGWREWAACAGKGQCGGLWWVGTPSTRSISGTRLRHLRPLEKASEAGAESSGLFYRWFWRGR